MFVCFQSAVHRVLPQGSQELPSYNHMPLLDDSVQVIEPAGPMPLPLPAQAFESATASSSSAPPPMFAHLAHQPRPLVSVSADYLTNRSRARILSFTIVWNGIPTELMVVVQLGVVVYPSDSRFHWICLEL